MSVQLVGFGLAGLIRRFLVKPAAMYWPEVLASVALFVNFHEIEETDPKAKYKMPRFTFFMIVAGGFFVYTWLPQYFLTVLQIVSILCLVTSNADLKFLASGNSYEGVGLGAITFDWNNLGTNPLVAPFWATLQYTISNL